MPLGVNVRSAFTTNPRRRDLPFNETTIYATERSIGCPVELMSMPLGKMKRSAFFTNPGGETFLLADNTQSKIRNNIEYDHNYLEERYPCIMDRVELLFRQLKPFTVHFINPIMQ